MSAVLTLSQYDMSQSDSNTDSLLTDSISKTAQTRGRLSLSSSSNLPRISTDSSAMPVKGLPESQIKNDSTGHGAKVAAGVLTSLAGFALLAVLGYLLRRRFAQKRAELRRQEEFDDDADFGNDPFKEDLYKPFSRSVPRMQEPLTSEKTNWQGFVPLPASLSPAMPKNDHTRSRFFSQIGNKTVEDVRCERPSVYSQNTDPRRTFAPSSLMPSTLPGQILPSTNMPSILPIHQVRFAQSAKSEAATTIQFGGASSFQSTTTQAESATDLPMGRSRRATGMFTAQDRLDGDSSFYSSTAV